MLNAYWEALTFELPPVSASSPERWHRCIDTALPSPDDILLWDEAPPLVQTAYELQPRTVALLALQLQTTAENVAPRR